jgi:membrane-bound metal-dependent hydrolase YbcI (DUF457 family)
MNPLVHVSIGLHIANLGFYQRYGRRASLILATASLFPDLDSVSLFISRDAYYALHRGFTHALSGWIVCGALLALLTAHRDLQRWFVIDWGLWALGMAGHTAADIITRWPIPVLYPVSGQSWSLGLVSWGDGFLTLCLPGLALAAALWSKRRRMLSSLALATSLLYLAYRAAVPAPGSSWLSRIWFGLWFQ